MNEFGYIRDEQYAKLIEKFVDREEGTTDKKYYKHYKTYCFTRKG